MKELVNIACFLLVIALLYSTVIIIRNTFKNEVKRKSYMENMKVGDKVYFNALDSDINCEVFEIDGDTVKVIVKVSKNRVYPK